MKKKLLMILFIIWLVFTIKLLSNLVFYEIIVQKYEEGKLPEKEAKYLSQFTIIERYISYYNYGNMLFEKEDYEKAIEQYEKALKKNVPKRKECKIRINEALAICNTVELDEKNKESVLEAISIYESAIQVLVEEGCAHEEDEKGHSKKAQELKDDIEDEIDRLKNLKFDESQDDKKDEKQEEEKEQENTIEEKMKKIKEEAVKEQRDVEKQYENFKKSYPEGEKRW